VLTDYQDRFSTKATAFPPRSGMSQALLADFFRSLDVEPVFVQYADVDLRDECWNNAWVVYTSSEDLHLKYRSYIEDVCLALSLKGAKLIPAFQFLRAHHNKSFMEMLRDVMGGEEIKTIQSKYFGAYEELKSRADSIELPAVIKSAYGAGSVSVALAATGAELLEKAKKLSRSRQFINELREVARTFKHRGLVADSKYREKFIVQNFISGLKSDTKALVFGDRIYLLRRSVRENDFRASGSGKFSWVKEVDSELLDYCEKVRSLLDVPHVSMDVAYENGRYHLIEFQAVYFGSITVDRSDCYFERNTDSWTRVDSPSVLEEEYARSTVDYMKKSLSF
jgi:hypothetical protein